MILQRGGLNKACGTMHPRVCFPSLCEISLEDIYKYCSRKTCQGTVSRVRQQIGASQHQPDPHSAEHPDRGEYRRSPRYGGINDRVGL